MGCGASSVYPGTKGNLHQANRNIRINIIEATSIIDYEDTDTISSRRQTPIIPWQSQMAPLTPDKSAINLPESSEDSVERPLSPIPQNSTLLHRTSTSSQLLEQKELEPDSLNS